MKSNSLGPAESNRLVNAVQLWADGKATLKEVRGYSDNELYAVARAGYAFFNQGKLAEARTIFQGLFAVNPRDAYFAQALAVVEYAAGNQEGALAAFDVAIRLDQNDPGLHVGRAEVLLALGRQREALGSLRIAANQKNDLKQANKARALLKAIEPQNLR